MRIMVTMEVEIEFKTLITTAPVVEMLHKTGTRTTALLEVERETLARTTMEATPNRFHERN